MVHPYRRSSAYRRARTYSLFCGTASMVTCEVCSSLLDLAGTAKRTYSWRDPKLLPAMSQI